MIFSCERDICFITRWGCLRERGFTSCSSSVVAGYENNYRNYVNQYSTNTLALSKAQHQEERDRRRYLAYKFSLTPISEFKWNGSIHGNRSTKNI